MVEEPLATETESSPSDVPLVEPAEVTTEGAVPETVAEEPSLATEAESSPADLPDGEEEDMTTDLPMPCTPDVLLSISRARGCSWSTTTSETYSL